MKGKASKLNRKQVAKAADRGQRKAARMATSNTKVEKRSMRRGVKGDARAAASSLEETARLFLHDIMQHATSDDDDNDAEQRVTKKKDATPVALKKKKSAKREEKEVAAAGKGQTLSKKRRSPKLSVPLEEGGDAEDEAVSQQVLARTSAFLSKLGASRKQKFWNLRGVAQGSAKKANDNQPSKRGQEDIDSEDDAASTSSSDPSWIAESDDDNNEDDVDSQEATDTEGEDAVAEAYSESSSSSDSDGIWDD